MANRYNERYVHGSEAPARDYNSPVRIPRPRQEEPLTKEQIRKRQAERYAEENRRKAGRFGGLFTALIVAAVSVTLFTCVNFISLQSDKTENKKQIAALQSEIAELKELNDQKQLAIDTSIDYDYIYKVATEELGMMHAESDQIVRYESGESEYVIQYMNVPSK